MRRALTELVAKWRDRAKEWSKASTHVAACPDTWREKSGAISLCADELAAILAAPPEAEPAGVDALIVAYGNARILAYRDCGEDDESCVTAAHEALTAALAAAREAERARVLKEVQRRFGAVERNDSGASDEYNLGHEHGERMALGDVVTWLQDTPPAPEGR